MEKVCEAKWRKFVKQSERKFVSQSEDNEAKWRKFVKFSVRKICGVEWSQQCRVEKICEAL